MIPVIFGCVGTTLSEAEHALFAEARPAGLILFGRNCDSAEQVRALTRQFAETVERENPLVLIDQEGGRVVRLGPPLCPKGPPAARFGELFAADPARGRDALETYCRILATCLLRLGISVNCYPVVDVRMRGADDVIGDRAFSDDPEIVAALGRVAVDTLMAAGLLPVIKHIPGHGRAMVDSHKAAPVVDAGHEALNDVDFKPFRALADAPLAMTAHITYSAWDDEACATVSPVIIEDVIRAKIGFQGLLMTDDITMGALEGPVADRAKTALSAGCDLVLHCSGDLDEMQAVAGDVPKARSDLQDHLAVVMDGAMAAGEKSSSVDVDIEQRRLEELIKS